VTLESPLKSEIKLDVVINEAGELEDSSIILYKSPIAKYEGKFSLIITPSGLEAANFAEVKTNSDGSFNLKLISSKVTADDAKDYVLTVSYGDMITKMIKTEMIAVKVSYTDNTLIEEEAAQEGSSEGFSATTEASSGTDVSQD
jgi:hypothetical protein